MVSIKLGKYIMIVLSFISRFPRWFKSTTRRMSFLLTTTLIIGINKRAQVNDYSFIIYKSLPEVVKSTTKQIWFLWPITLYNQINSSSGPVSCFMRAESHSANIRYIWTVSPINSTWRIKRFKRLMAAVDTWTSWWISIESFSTLQAFCKAAIYADSTNSWSERQASDACCAIYNSKFNKIIAA